MRLARPLALTATAVLAAGIAAPAAADDSNDAPGVADNNSGSLTIEVANPGAVTATSNATFQGTGCIAGGRPGSIVLSIGTGNDHYTTLEPVPAAADGTWSVTVDMAEATADAGGDVKTDPWVAHADCFLYNGEKKLQKEAAFDLTPLSGKAVIHTDAAGKQTLELVDGKGFNPNVSVEVSLVPAKTDGTLIDDAEPLVLGTLMTDENGNLSGEVPVPSNIPDGTYGLSIVPSSPEGEQAVLRNAVYVAKDGVLSSTGTDGGSSNDGGNVEKPADSSNAVPAAHKDTKKEAPKSQLANTGVGAPAIGLLALGLVGAGAFAVKRRNA